MRSGVRSSFLLKGISETELKFILFVVGQPVCLLSAESSMYLPSGPNGPLVHSQGHRRDVAEAGWCSELMKLRLKV